MSQATERRVRVDRETIHARAPARSGVHSGTRARTRHRRLGPRRANGLAGLLASLLALGLAAAPARGALPPRHGGTLTLPSPEPVATLDPTRARTYFEATLARAVFDGLYAVRGGVITPVLAEGLPEIEGNVATIHLRPGVLHHGGRPLEARHVVRSLSRLSSAPEAAWLLAAFASDHGRVAVREVDRATIAIQLARPGVNVARILAAAPMAIVVGGNLGARPYGTGPYRARLDGHGGIDLRMFRAAPEGAPWLHRVRFTPPLARDDEIRAFELGRADGSWWGRSLYHREPTRPVRTASAEASAPILLVPNRTRALRDTRLLGGLFAAVDRGRLERVGLTPSASLGADLPAPELPPPAPLPHGTRLSMLVRADSPFEARLGEAMAGLLDEHGVRLAVERVADARYEAAVARGDWDLRLALARPPLPLRGARVGAALAAAGQLDRARRMALSLDDAEAAARAARSLGAMVIGHERIVLHHRADLVDLRFDVLGRLDLADLSFARPPEAP